VRVAGSPDGRLGYVAALDGLRGIAIAVVLGYHFLGLPGGYLGVDFFFVLSGFLITTLLLEEHAATGRISLRRFYERRARRLLPALGAVLLFSLLVATLNFEAGPAGWGWTRVKAVGICLAYSANIFRALGHQLPIEVSPLWSLAQEEQFYFLWPAVLILLLRRGVDARRLAGWLLIAACGFAFWRGYLAFTHGATSRVFFGPDMRADGLLLGCALAALRHAGVQLRLRPPVWVMLAAGGGLMAVAESGAAYALALPAAELAAAGVIVAAVAGVGGPLAWRPIVWLGSISYGLYVWQGPVLLLGGHGIAPAAVAVGLGWLSSRFIEAPFRRRRALPAIDGVPVAATGGGA
jgi:peptidoglycan/LPS O-acetylase OafA/YrhL